jgi:hypothetical protein
VVSETKFTYNGLPIPNYHFGKHPAKDDYRTLFSNITSLTGLAAPPPPFKALTNVNQKLKRSNPTTQFLMENDTLGDCTIADLAHATTVYNGLARERKI